MPEPDPVSPEQVSSEIAEEISRVHEQSYGAGLSKIDVYVVDNAVFVIMDVELARSEQTLTDAGKADSVRVTREAYQEAIAPTFRAIVERATGRKVNSFVSRMNMDPPFSVEIFRLEPQP